MDASSLLAIPRLLGLQDNAPTMLSSTATSNPLGLPISLSNLRTKWNRGTPSVAVDLAAPLEKAPVPTGNNVRPKPQQQQQVVPSLSRPDSRHIPHVPIEKVYAPLPVTATARLRSVVSGPKIAVVREAVSVDPVVLLATPFGVVSAWHSGREEKTVLLRRITIPVGEVESKAYRVAAIDTVSYRTTVTISEGGGPSAASLHFRGGRGRGGFRGRGGPHHQMMTMPIRTRTVEKVVHLVASVSNGYVGLFLWDGSANEVSSSDFKSVLPISDGEGFQCEHIDVSFSPSGSHLAVWRQQRILDTGSVKGALQETAVCILSVAMGSGNLGMTTVKVPWTPVGSTTLSWVTDDLLVANDRRFGVVKLYARMGSQLLELPGPGGSGGAPGWQVTAPVIRTLRTTHCSTARHPVHGHPLSFDLVVHDINHELQHVRLVSSDANMVDPHLVAAVSKERSGSSNSRGKRNRDGEEGTITTSATVTAPTPTCGPYYSLLPLTASLDAAHLHHHGMIEHIDVVPSSRESALEEGGGTATITITSGRKGQLSTTLLHSTPGQSTMQVVKNWTQPLRVATSSSGVYQSKLPMDPAPAVAFAFPSNSDTGVKGCVAMVHDEFCGTI